MSNAIHDTILEQIPESMIVVNSDLEILFFNPEAERLQQLIQRPLQMGIPLIDVIADDRKRLVEFTLNQVKAMQVPRVLEVEIKEPGGGSVFYEEAYNPVWNAEEGHTMICIISREITSQKLFERRTIQLVRELSSLTENANAVIFGVDSRGYITEWNKECVRVTQYEKNEIFAKKIEQLVTPEFHEGFTDLLNRVMRGNSVSNFECRIKTKGEPITALVNATPKTNAIGDVIGALFVGQDITELTNYRRSLEEKVHDRTEKLKAALQKEKELVEVKNRFVSIASHEFKVPLASIEVSVNAVKTNKTLRKSDRERLMSIEKQVHHMKMLLEDILTVEKGEMSKLKANYQRLDLVAFLKKMTVDMEATHPTHRIKTEFTNGSVVVESDEKLLKNIFLNLLSNAIKFSPSKPEIFLSVKKEGDQVKVEVRDQGIGIEEKDLKKIFEPFNRGSNTG
ncbi:MAG: PAS domain-containing sensor histidine kinase, partial [Bacteroidota bacterium]